MANTARESAAHAGDDQAMTDKIPGKFNGRVKRYSP